MGQTNVFEAAASVAQPSDSGAMGQTNVFEAAAVEADQLSPDTAPRKRVAKVKPDPEAEADSAKVPRKTKKKADVA